MAKRRNTATASTSIGIATDHFFTRRTSSGDCQSKPIKNSSQPRRKSHRFFGVSQFHIESIVIFQFLDWPDGPPAVHQTLRKILRRYNKATNSQQTTTNRSE